MQDVNGFLLRGMINLMQSQASSVSNAALLLNINGSIIRLPSACSTYIYTQLFTLLLQQLTTHLYGVHDSYACVCRTCHIRRYINYASLY